MTKFKRIIHTPAYTLYLDRYQATKQLQALGSSCGDAVDVRAFLPKEDPRYAPGTGCFANKLNAGLGGGQ